MAEKHGEELEENFQIQEIEEIIFVANENMKNQSYGFFIKPVLKCTSSKFLNVLIDS